MCQYLELLKYDVVLHVRRLMMVKFPNYFGQYCKS